MDPTRKGTYYNVFDPNPDNLVASAIYLPPRRDPRTKFTQHVVLPGAM